MSTFRYGERFSTSGTYSKHPPGSSSWLQNGDPLDSGSVHIIENNVVHLAAEATRTLIWDVLPGAVSYEGRGYDYDDVQQPVGEVSDVPSSEEYRIIGWGRKNSRRYGPFFAVRDEIAADGSFIPRGIRLKLEHSDNATTPMRMFAAITRTAAPPTEGVVTWGEFAQDTSGPPAISTLTLRATTWPGGTPPPPVLCRDDSLSTLHVAPSSTPVVLWIWLGWYVPDGTKIQYLYSFSAYETRA